MTSYRLDATVAEWRVLTAVRPFFAGPVPWDLVAPVGNADPDVAATANAITIDKVKEVFANEMGEMRINLIDLSGFKLEQQSYKICCDKIRVLLQLLENLVLERVLHDPDSREGSAPPVEDQDENEVYQSALFTQTLKRAVWTTVCTWLGIESAVPKPEQTSTTKDIRPGTLTARKTPHKQPYRKLEALGRIIAKRSKQSKHWVESCSVFLNLQPTLDEFKNLKAQAMKVNRVVDGLPQRMGTAGSSAPGVQKFSRTNWESRKATDLSDRLYRLLGEAICNGSDEHEAELQLNGFRLDESCVNSPLVQDMLVSSCPTGDVWHQCRCTSILQNSAVAPNVILSDLCGSIRRSKYRPLSIHFDEDDLWYNKACPQSPAHTDDSRMASLECLLEDGFFGKDRDGDIFNPNDKAVLVLSLARCLVHLWHGLWTRGLWTAESIQFFCRRDEVLDRHCPYITCTLMKNTGNRPEPIEPTPDDLQLSVLSFAQLLAEIETGKRIHSDLSIPNLENFKDDIEDAMEPRKNEFGRDDYNAAVQKCLQFMALLRREAAEGEEDLLSLARNVLYDNIIKPLEANFNQIPDPAAAMISRPLKIQGHTTSHAPIAPISQIKSGNTPAPISPQRGTPRQEFPATSIKHHDAQKPEQHIPYAMFFDEESTVRPEHIKRAETFFRAFDKFRKRHIIPKINEGRDGRRRIRIAVLDTGVDRENGDVRGLVDEISDARKKQKFPKADRDPIKGIKSFTGDDGVDKFGHGTHVAGLVLQTAPDADLYIAKVSCDKRFTDMGAIVKAIDWAIENEVDIICMSFGCEFDVESVADALDRASNTKRNKMILLAAASNDGRNSKRTFPARHEGVIAIHALDGKGNDEGGMNPSRKGYVDNFGTLGLGIKTSWDAEIPPEPGSSPGTPSTTKVMHKSGSSYATPIAAGIVANCIEWIDYMSANGRLTAHQYAFLRRPKGIRLMLKKQSETVGDILSIAPWILWKEDPLDPVTDGEAPRKVDEKADNHVLELLLEELHPVKPE